MTENELKKLLKEGHVKIHENSVPRTITNVEQTSGYEQVAEEKTERFNRPVSITVRSYRHRLADHGGVSEKYVIDAIVDRGILQDDSPKFVEAVHHEQIKVPKAEEEKTEILIEVVNPE